LINFLEFKPRLQQLLISKDKVSLKEGKLIENYKLLHPNPGFLNK